MGAVDNRRYLLMVRVDETPQTTFWAAAKVEGVGRVLTRAQAEHAAPPPPAGARFLLPFGEHREKFAREDSPNTLAIVENDSPWEYGEPLQADLLEVLRSVMHSAESPSPDTVLLPVGDVVDAAREWLGAGDDHAIETHFDQLVMELGGTREREPAEYHAPIAGILGFS